MFITIDSKMLYYHVYVKYRPKDLETTEKSAAVFEYNLTKKIVEQSFAIPYMNNRTILLHGHPVHRREIDAFDIFKSKKPYEKLILANGKSPLDEDDPLYILKCFAEHRVNGWIDFVTYDFITSLQEEKEQRTKPPTKPLGKKDKIFIVHGRDDKQALLLQKYLTRKLKLDTIVFDDLPDKGKTIMEQLEYVRDNVGYAIVIATPDDVGCLVEDIDQLETVMTRGRKSIKIKELDEILDLLTTRPRQNVIFELGLFIGALGRDKICYLLQKDVQDELSDLRGILHKSFDKTVEEVFHEIADELK